MVKRISGIIRYIDLEGGFWGIEAEENYYPINFPEQLKTENEKIHCSIIIDDDLMTLQQWGIPCRILSFLT